MTLKYQIVAGGLHAEPCTYYPTREGAESQFERIRMQTNGRLHHLRVIETDQDAPVEVYYGKPK